jgi:hypothetical protein
MGGRKAIAGWELCVLIIYLTIFMYNQGKKITLFLADGEPDGRKILTLGGWNGLGLMFPRNKLKEIGNDEMAQKPGVYFLFGKESEDSVVTSAYIGEAENLFDRLTTHNNDKNKEFWYMTIAFVSSDDSLTKAHVKYLESRCVQLAYEVKHFGYILKNGKESLPASLPRADIPVMEEFLSNANLLLATVGYPILHKLESKMDTNKDNPLFFCQSKDLKAKGTARMTNEGFILYKGSTISVNQSKSISERNEKIITKLLSEEIIKETDSGYMFERDYNFTSPSAAADLIVGYSVNGWDIWKTQDGKTLDAVYRHSL